MLLELCRDCHGIIFKVLSKDLSSILTLSASCMLFRSELMSGNMLTSELSLDDRTPMADVQRRVRFATLIADRVLVSALLKDLSKNQILMMLRDWKPVDIKAAADLEIGLAMEALEEYESCSELSKEEIEHVLQERQLIPNDIPRTIQEYLLTPFQSMIVIRNPNYRELIVKAFGYKMLMKFIMPWLNCLALICMFWELIQFLIRLSERGNI